jgi:uncharacterized protein (TIGR03437 family)
VDGTIAYDPGGRRVFLFGGLDGSGALNDLWAYSLERRRWEAAAVPGARPAARFGHTMLLDPVRNRLVVFGGQERGFFSDVWAFDIAENSWRQLSPEAAGPSRRYGHSAIYDAARDRMIVSHGFTNSGRFDDTWAFDFASNTWRDISPSGTRPLRRCLHHAVYDAANNQMLLYGGCASGFGPCPLGDLWSFDLATQRWTEVTAQLKPPAREHYGRAFDAVRGKFVIFGGSGGGLLNDTWSFDAQTRTWEQVTPQGPAPAARSRHESAYAADRGNIFFFGGSTNTGRSNELWMLGPGFASPRPEFSAGSVLDAFSNAGGAVAPGELLSIYGSDLGPLNDIAFTFDASTGRLPTSGPGLRVTFNGVAAPLYFARADQLNVQAPYEVAGAAEVRVVVTVNGQSSDPVTIPLAPTHPGLFPRIWNEEGTVNSADTPAAPGSVVVLYATGQGVTVPASPTGAKPAEGLYPVPAGETTLRIGDEEAELLFRGQAPGTAGVMQINARVPVSPPGGPIPVVLRIGGAEARPLLLHKR